MENRYEQIYDLLDKHLPKTILEIGTWDGVNGVRMMQEAKAEHYIGFDLFEEGSEEIDEIEYNVKRRTTLEEVDKLFKEMSEKVGFTYELHKGNSRLTLKQMVQEQERRNELVDFAFVDGGHSVGTIKQDLNNVMNLMKPDGIVVVDDYYYEVPTPGVGAHEALCTFKYPYTVLPHADGVSGGGYVKLAVIDLKDVALAYQWAGGEDNAWKFEVAANA